jgi:hypothetical protein
MHALNNVVTGYIAHTISKRIFPDIRLLSEATLLRVWCKYDSAQSLFDKFTAQQYDDDLLFIPPFPEWHDSAIIKVLGDTYKRHEHVVETLALDHRGLQSTLLRALSASSFDAAAFPALVMQRLRKLGVTRDASEQIVSNIRAALQALPLNVVTSLVKAAINAWTTTQRMGHCIGPCPFCQQAGQDSMAHCLSCGLAGGVVASLLPRLALPRSPSPLFCMLGGVPLPAMTAAGLAIAVDCIHAAAMGARFGGTAGSGLELAAARLRVLCLACRRTRNVAAAFR